MVALLKDLVLLGSLLLVEAKPPSYPPPAYNSPPSYSSSKCNADKCFAAANLPSYFKPIASTFCLQYLHTTTGTVTKTSTVSVTATTTLSPVTTTSTATTTITASAVTTTSTLTSTFTPAQPISVTTVTQTALSVTPCSTTVSGSATTQVNYQTLTPSNQKRDPNPPGYGSPSYGWKKPAIPAQLSGGCPGQNVEQRISSACSCFLTSTTITTTTTGTVSTSTITPSAVTTTVTSTINTALPTVTVLTRTTITGTTPTPRTTTSTATTTSNTCTSTSTVLSVVIASCGILSPTAPTAGSITCANTAAAPGETNSRFRIEGNDSDGTIFEDCLSSGPANITTPSGGTHLCDGTNDNANPTPGATLTTQINAASILNGFSFDGSYSSSFQDFFITRIANSAQTGNQYWGVLSNLAFTPRGGCQSDAPNGDTGLWSYNAFNFNAFLKIDQDYQVVRLGETLSVTVTVTQVDGNGGSSSPASGASLGTGAATTDGNGQITIPVPSVPGCYQYKATRSGASRSNAFYLTVLPSA